MCLGEGGRAKVAARQAVGAGCAMQHGTAGRTDARHAHTRLVPYRAMPSLFAEPLPTSAPSLRSLFAAVQEDAVNRGDVETLVDTFPGQSIDFFGALRARVYDDMVRKWIAEQGVEKIGTSLINTRQKVSFPKASMTLDILLKVSQPASQPVLGFRLLWACCWVGVVEFALGVGCMAGSAHQSAHDFYAAPLS